MGDFGDPIGQTIPNKFLLVEYLKNGIMPLWNPFSFLGFPFLADIQVGTFYIPDILFFSLFNPLVAHNISVLTHLILAATGTYLFTNEITKNRAASISLGLMLALGATYLSKIVFLNFLEVISYLPWLLLLITRKNCKLWGVTLVFTLMILAGHPIALFYSLIISSIFLAINNFEKWKKFLPALLLAILISGIQIIPFIELKMNSVRDALTYDQFIDGGMTIWELLRGVFIPIQESAFQNFDSYIYIANTGIVAAAVGLLFVKKYNKKERKIFAAGIVLCILGGILALGGNLPIVAKILYETPIFNLVRVPARYIILFHFGILLLAAVSLKQILGKQKKLGAILIAAIILNSALIPTLFLNKSPQGDGENMYMPEIKREIEQIEENTFSIDSTPQYFLSSSLFIFPNRHVINFMPNVTGYNPMTLKSYYEALPVAPVGSFTDPDYLANLYNEFEEIGVKYYIFPTEKYLKTMGLGNKMYVTEFLEGKNWNKIVTSTDYEIWKSPFNTEFAYFTNEASTIKSIDFSPGEITLEVENITADTLIVNQSFYPGWKAKTNKGESITPKAHKGYLQAYEIPADTGGITIKYTPSSLHLGFLTSLIGLALLSILIIRSRRY